MFSLFKKSAHEITEELFPIAMEVGENIARQNYLQLPLGMLAHRRFVIGAQLFSNLMCQDIVTSVDKDQARAIGICQLLSERHITAVSRDEPTQVPLTHIVVWEDELEWIRCHPINPKLAGVDLALVSLSLGDIVRELHVVRFSRLTSDMLKGAAVQVQRGPASLAFLMPVCSSLIMQTIAHEPAATDEQIVSGFAAAMMPQWAFLQGSVEQALK